MRFNEMPREKHLELARKGGSAPHPKKPMRTHCNKGHLLEGDNVRPVIRSSWNTDHTKKYIYTTYQCRQCDLDGAKARKAKYREQRNRVKFDALQGPQPVKYCKHGHALVGDNVKIYLSIRVTSDGVKNRRKEIICRQCLKDRYRRNRYGNINEPDHRIYK